VNNQNVELRQNLRTMKKALMILSIFWVEVGAFAQGSVNFSPRVLGVYDATVFLGSLTGVRAEGPAYLVQLFVGVTPTSLVAVGDALPFRTGAAAGYWFAEGLWISTVDACGNAFFQVRAWPTAAGTTYEAASASGYVGSSAILTVTPISAPYVPATLTGLTSFAIPITPQPPIMALGMVVDLGTPVVTLDQQIHFTITGLIPGKQAVVQSSTGLCGWLSVSTIDPSTNTFDFVDPDAANYSQRFYRVALSP
jgi:hypothetical protein